MAPRSHTPTTLDSLAPDQRAAVELVLRRGRSYAELAELLGITEPTVRARARGALEALAPDTPPPAESGRVADWLLGQQEGAEAEATRALLDRDPATRAWAATVAAPLRPLGGDRVPDIPTPGSDLTARPRPRPLRDAARKAGAGAAADAGADARAAAAARGAEADAAPAQAERNGATRQAAPGPRLAPRSSRLGGAILLGVLAIVVVGFLVWLLALRGGGSSPSTSTGANAPAPTPTVQQTGNDVVLRGINGSKAAGLMRLFKTQSGDVQFGLAAQGVPPNKGKEVYAIWFVKKNGQSRRLGFAQTQVGKDGVLTTGGPQAKDLKAFPRWFATYDAVLVTRETTAKASRPGPIVLEGALPHAQG